MTRQQFRLVLSDFGELAFESFCDTGVERTSGLAQQGAVGRILHQRMFEQISRVRRRTLPKQQTGCSVTVERRYQVSLRRARHRSHQGIRKRAHPSLPPDLRHLLSGAEPVEPRHQ